MRPLRQRQDATTATFGTLVSLFVFAAMAGVVFEYSVETRAPLDKADTAELQMTAARLADRIFGQTGAGWFKPGHCDDGTVDPDHFDADNVTDFGLKAEACDNFSSLATNHVDYYKMRNLKDAGYTSTTNNRSDYEDARSVLGLDGTGVQFRLEGTPALPTLHGGSPQDYGLSAAYIGDYNYEVVGVQEPGLPVPDCIPTGAGCMPPVCPLGCLLPTDIYGWVPRNSTLNETAWLDHLAGDFERAAHNATYNNTNLSYAAGGDVFADDTNGLQGDLPGLLLDGQGEGTLDNYNLLIVGASVAGNQMNEVRDPLDKWVRAGGFLVILGSDSDLSWTESKFKVKLKTHSATPTAPDPDDAALNLRTELDWETYDERDRAWEYNSGGSTPFKHVLVDGSKDYLAVSRDGEFGEGRILLSAFQPDRMLAPSARCETSQLSDGVCEPLRFLHNLLTVPYDTLYFSYGPTPSAQSAVAQHPRIVTTYHPSLQTTVDLRVQVSIWREGVPRYTTSPEPPPTGFPWDYYFMIESPSAETTYHNETFTALSENPLATIHADPLDFTLVATSYEVHVVMNPHACTTPGSIYEGGWNLPVVSPIQWETPCGQAGLWTIEIYGEAAPLATGGLRVSVYET